MHTLSLRLRLLLLLLLVTLLTWSVTAFVLYRDARREAGALLDAQLAQSARLVLNEAPHRLHELQERNDDEEEDQQERGRKHHEPESKHGYEQALFYQLWDDHGNLLYRSSKTVPTTALVAGEPGFQEFTVSGVPWRTFGLWNAEHTLQIQIGAPRPRRDQLSGALATRILTPVLVMLPLLGFFVWFAVGVGLSPLRRLAGEIASRSPSGLSPVSEEVPSEAKPLVEAINQLFLRTAETLRREQRFTADAAHELRTPLAALKTQTQVALSALDPMEQKHALHQIHEGIDRAGRLIENLLMLARLEPEEQMEHSEKLNLVSPVSDACSELAQGALAKNIDFELQAAEAAPILGNAELLRILARNLIDNAIRYSHPGAKVLVTVKTYDSTGELVVEDNGAGIPPDQYGRVFDRFYRIVGSGVPGSGLGLSIVRKIASLHAATVELGPGVNGRGLRVTVRFALAA